jgi:hypothetical protein
MGHRNAYKDMLDKVVSPIACVNMNHQNQLEQMANGAMFATEVERAAERTLMSPRGGWIGEMTDLNFSSPNTWADSAHQSDQWWWPVRPVRHWTSQETPVRLVCLTSQTGMAQSTCKNNFKHLLTSSKNQTWWVAFVDDHKQGNEPCTHK